MMNNTENTKTAMPLNLQFFAEPAATPAADTTNNADTTNTEQTGKTEVDIEKLLADEKVNKFLTDRVTRAEQAALVNYLKNEGMTEDEAKEAFKAFKATKEAEAKEAENSKTEADKIKDKEIEDLKAAATAAQEALNNMIIQNTLEKQALSLGVDPKRLDIALKIADLKNITITDGKVDEEAAKKEIEAVLDKLPELKIQATSNNGVVFGAHQSESSQTPNNTKTMTYRQKLEAQLHSNMSK